MEALRSPLMLAAKARPVQAVGLLVLRLPDRLEEATHLRHAQLDPLISNSTFFS
jgi:hypothetical protein